MTAAAVGTLRESSGHLGRGIGSEELHFGPEVMDTGAQEVEREVLVAQSLSDADDAFDRSMPVVDTVLLRIAEQTQHKRRHAHDRVRLQTKDRIPLQFRNAVSDTDDTCP